MRENSHTPLLGDYKVSIHKMWKRKKVKDNDFEIPLASIFPMKSKHYLKAEKAMRNKTLPAPAVSVNQGCHSHQRL